LARWIALVSAAMLLLAACGGGGGEQAEGEGTGAEETGGDQTAGEDGATEGGGEEITLTFKWFEWPPAQILEDFANENYPNENVTIEVDAVPLGQWHDSVFTEFAAQDTEFDIPILDSQWIGEAVTGGHIDEITDWARNQADINLDDYNSYMLAAYGQYPQTTTGELEEDASLYGLPLTSDTQILVYRTDLVGDEPPQTYQEMVEMGQQCEEENPEMHGLGFHQGASLDEAAVVMNTQIWSNGGDLWNQEERQVEGVLNSQAGKDAISFLVNEMKPLTPAGSGDWFISEVNAAMSQGTICIGQQWVAGLPGILDPEGSTLGDSKEEIRSKLGFAQLPAGPENRPAPLGGMGMHISNYIPDEKKQAAKDFIEWFMQPDTQQAWGVAGGFPAATEALESEEFRDAAPWNGPFADSVPRLRDFWNIPAYADMLDVHNSKANAALTGNIDPVQALNDIAQQEQEILDRSGTEGGGGGGL
jgi:multiple sugar transport system substrate-binding protein